MRIDKTTKVKITDALEMVGFIRTNGTRCQFISLLTKTEPALKAGHPFGKVTKVAKRFGLINVNFNAAVARKVAKQLNVEPSQVTYVSGETWYVHEQTSDNKALPLCKNKKRDDGKFYLQFYPRRNATAKYFDGEGNEISKEKLTPYFRPVKPSTFKPIVNVIGMENIAEMVAANVIIQTNQTEEMQNKLAA